MFQKLHLQLTILCGSIITVVIFLMTLCILYVSHNNMKETRYLSFLNNIDSVCANLEQQTVITHEWLSKLEASHDFLLFLTDQGTSLLFNQRHHDEEAQMLYEQALTYYDTLKQDTPPVSIIPNQASAVNFSLSDSSGTAYYCAVIELPSTQGHILQMVVLSSLAPLTLAMQKQCLLFCSIALAALIILWLFSALFTQKLLAPVQKNHEKQKQFIAAASHELRTPLAVLLSCLEQCKKMPTPEDSHALTAIMEEEVQRMSSLVQDMLTLSQADNHALTLKKVPTELDTLLLSVSESFEAMARGKNLHLQVILPNDTLAPCLCDTTRIRQVLSILLHNAISYALPSHTGNIKLSVACQAGKCFTLTITDYGPGIADDEKEKIWEPFYKSEKSRSTKGHFGLGLSIAHEIVRAHHGSIAISDTPGGGATFIITLPDTESK